MGVVASALSAIQNQDFLRRTTNAQYYSNYHHHYHHHYYDYDYHFSVMCGSHRGFQNGPRPRRG